MFQCNFPNDYHIESVALGVPHCFEHVFRSCPSCHHVSWKFSSAGFSVNAPHVTPATPIFFSGNRMFETGGHESQHKLLMLTWHLHLNIPLHSRQPNNPLWRSSTPEQNRHQQGLGLSPEKVDASSVSLPFWDCHLKSCDRPPATHCGGLFPRAKPFQSATPSPWWRTHNLRKSADGHLSADFRGDFGGKPGKPPGFFPCFCHQISGGFFTTCSLKLIPGISGISNDMPHKSQDGHGWTEHVSGSETSHGSHDVDPWPADCRLATGSATEQIHRYNSFNHQLSVPIRQSSESESIKDPRKNMNDLPIEHGGL